MDKTYVDGIREGYRDGFKDGMEFAFELMNNKDNGNINNKTNMVECDGECPPANTSYTEGESTA